MCNMMLVYFSKMNIKTQALLTGLGEDYAHTCIYVYI
jgi:hypothetical protein